MVNINKLLNGEKLEYQNDWVYSNAHYYLYLSRKRLFFYVMQGGKHDYSVQSCPLNELSFMLSDHSSLTNIDCISIKISSLTSSNLYDDHSIIFLFPSTDEGAKIAEEVFEAIHRLIDRD